MIRSHWAASYEPVEDGEYEVLEHEGLDSPQAASPPASAARNVPAATVPNGRPRRGSVPFADDGGPARMLRTVSSGSSSVPLSHPTPDLQSLQGAYAGNVERLEQSAERMSLRSDLDEEIRRLRHEQQRASPSRRSSVRPSLSSRQYSLASLSHSIRSLHRAARAGGFSPDAYVASPVGSAMSPRPWSPRSLHERTALVADRDSPRFEPEKEGLPLDSPVSVKPTPLMVRNSTSQELLNIAGDVGEDTEIGRGGELEVPGRVPSTASGDTSQRAAKEFEDFDGVHTRSDREELAPMRPSPTQDESTAAEPPTQRAGRASMPPQPPAEDMVFYPAPVPMMLKLPQRLSKVPPASQLAQRKSQALQAAMASSSNRKSAPLLSPDKATFDAASVRASEASKRTSELPPQLRATMFFEQKPVQHEIQIKQGSAVATLDSILDASAHAPVSAFTDHPIVGQLGSEVYGGVHKLHEAKGAKARRSRNSAQLLGSRVSSAPVPGPPKRGISMVVEDQKAESKQRMSRDAAGEEEDDARGATPLRGSIDEGSSELDDEDETHSEAEHDDADESDEPAEEGAGRPTTLLAELQWRKERQKQRNKTAAMAFPHGMHSTLLQMDAVAQVQKAARQHKHVTLAWEDATVAHPQDTAADDDVPLGVLYPGKAAQRMHDAATAYDDDRPLGLLAQRAMEDAEPLSRRRARLIGGPAAARAFDAAKRASTIDLGAAARATQQPPQGVNGDGNESDEGETLAQRRKRLRNAKRIDVPRPVSGDFASEMISQLGAAPPADAPAPAKTPDPEETLGQRRKRLLAERGAGVRQASGGSAPPSNGATPPAPERPAAVARVRCSMADLLQAHPIGPAAAAAPAPGISPHGLVGGLDVRRQTLHAPPRRRNYGAAMAYGQNGVLAGVGGVNGHADPAYVNPMTFTPMLGMTAAGQGAGVAPRWGLPESAPVADHILLDTRARARIDEWRQGVE